MRLLVALEFAFGAFIVFFVAWQIAAPMLMGKPPFPWFRKEESRDPKVIGISKNKQGGTDGNNDAGK